MPVVLTRFDWYFAVHGAMTWGWRRSLVVTVRCKLQCSLRPAATVC